MHRPISPSACASTIVRVLVHRIGSPLGHTRYARYTRRTSAPGPANATAPAPAPPRAATTSCVPQRCRPHPELGARHRTSPVRPRVHPLARISHHGHGLRRAGTKSVVVLRLRPASRVRARGRATALRASPSLSAGQRRAGNDPGEKCGLAPGGPIYRRSRALGWRERRALTLHTTWMEDALPRQALPSGSSRPRVHS